jgi:hypothetical protein
MTGVVPYYEYSEEEVKARYSKRKFLETKFLGSIRDIITHCWHGRYSRFEAIITDINGMHAPYDIDL